jgi:hypothetical protein
MSSLTGQGFGVSLSGLNSQSFDDIDAETGNFTTINASVGNITTLNSTDVNTTNVYATNLLGLVQTGIQPNIIEVGTLGQATITTLFNDTINGNNINLSGTLDGDIVLGESANFTTIDATYINGLIMTASQPNITQLGTLPTATITTLTSTDVNSTNLTGTIQTASQPNITQLGTLPSATITILTSTDVNATNLTGTLQTASQPNITQVGTLPSATITILTSTDVNATNLTGTLQTASQPNITQVGTLPTATITTLTSTNINSSGNLAFTATNFLFNNGTIEHYPNFVNDWIYYARNFSMANTNTLGITIGRDDVTNESAIIKFEYNTSGGSQLEFGFWNNENILNINASLNLVSMTNGMITTLKSNTVQSKDGENTLFIKSLNGTKQISFTGDDFLFQNGQIQQYPNYVNDWLYYARNFSMVTTNTLGLTFGRDDVTNQSAVIKYDYRTTGGSQLQFGFWNNENILNINASTNLITASNNVTAKQISSTSTADNAFLHTIANAQAYTKSFTALNSSMTNGQNVQLTLGKAQSANQAGEISYSYYDNTETRLNRVQLGFYGNGDIFSINQDQNVTIRSGSPTNWANLDINGFVMGRPIIWEWSAVGSWTCPAFVLRTNYASNFNNIFENIAYSTNIQSFNNVGSIGTYYKIIPTTATPYTRGMFQFNSGVASATSGRLTTTALRFYYRATIYIRLPDGIGTFAIKPYLVDSSNVSTPSYTYPIGQDNLWFIGSDNSATVNTNRRQEQFTCVMSTSSINCHFGVAGLASMTVNEARITIEFLGYAMAT